SPTRAAPSSSADSRAGARTSSPVTRARAHARSRKETTSRCDRPSQGGVVPMPIGEARRAPRSRMRIAFAAVALFGALLSAGGAAAGRGGVTLRTERHTSEFTPDALPTPFSPFHSVRASALPTRALELFGEGLGFSLADDVSLVELEGGAAWHLLHSLSLTASYRLLDVHLGADAQLGARAGGRADCGAPFLGIALDF